MNTRDTVNRVVPDHLYHSLDEIDNPLLCTALSTGLGNNAAAEGLNCAPAAQDRADQ